MAIENYRKDRSVENTLTYAIDNVPFYREDPRYRKALGNLSGNNLEKILMDLPIIDGEIFKKRNYVRLIPDTERKHTIIFSTSGSTGEAKQIPTTDDTFNNAAFALYDVLSHIERNPTVFGEYTDFLKNIHSVYDIGIIEVPQKPAPSGEGFSRYLTIIDAIEVDRGPGEKALSVLSRANAMNRGGATVLLAYPPILLKDIYSMEESELKEFRQLVKDLNLSVILGGDYVSPKRAQFIRKELGNVASLSIIYSSTEEIMAIGPNDDIIELSAYNNLYSLLQDGKPVPINKSMVGLEGSLVLTYKLPKEGVFTPLINYNTKDIVKVLDVLDNGDIMIKYLGRADDIVHFGGAAKLSGSMMDDVLSSLMLKLGIGEGYFLLTEDRGLDKMLFYVSKENFTGTKEDVKRELYKELSSRQMELAYVLNNNLCSIDVEFLDRSDIPMYRPDRIKNKILIDNREK